MGHKTEITVGFQRNYALLNKMLNLLKMPLNGNLSALATPFK
jgi:hypothetical protein